MQEKLRGIVEAKYFQNFILGLIVLNGVTMGLGTSKDMMNIMGGFIEFFDTLVISIFTIEIILRIYVHRVSFFKDPWSLFDFTIVAISLIPTGAEFSILRILRVLRLFRLITVVPKMRKIIMALVSVIPGMFSISIILVLFFYIFAIMATQLYGETFPAWFGTLSESFYTLFQIMTLESWSMGIVRPIMEVHPNAWLFFVPFIFLVTFIMINLIVAIIVDAMSELAKEESSINEINEINSHTDETKAEVLKLRDEIKELKDMINNLATKKDI